jgi:hypothetical protein
MRFLKGLLCRAGLRRHEPGRTYFGWRCEMCGFSGETEAEVLGIKEAGWIKARDWGREE